MNRDLFLSILTMDSYNRGYGTGFKVALPESGQIGTANIVLRQSVGVDKQVYDSWISSGFYAIAYDVSGAGIVSAMG